MSGLGRAEKFDQVEAALQGYLRHHSKNAEPWMYESLAIAFDKNKRGSDEIKTALGYAAFLAQRNRKADDLTLVADTLFIRGFYDNFEVKVGSQTALVGVGPLLDAAADAAPHLAAPPMMSVNLALRTKDPKRMADALERLLSLGWPAIDDAIRQQARAATEALAKTLREDDRSSEADTLLTRLADLAGRDLYIRLTWTGYADLDLNVHEPLGAIASHNVKRTVFGGALIKEGRGKNREEVYVCPRAFDGDYTVRVDTIFNDDEDPARDATLEIITHEGLPNEHKETHTISLSKPNPVVVNLTGGRRKTVLPFIAPTVVVQNPSAKSAASTAAASPSTGKNPVAAPKPTSSSPVIPITPSGNGSSTKQGRNKPAPSAITPDRKPGAPNSRDEQSASPRL